ARLPVAVVHLQFYRDDVSPVFQRGDADAEPFALQPCRAHKERVPGDDAPRHAHRLQPPALHRPPVRQRLAALHTGGDGVRPRRFLRTDGGVEAVVAFPRIVRDERRVCHGLRQGGHHRPPYIAYGFCLHALFACTHRTSRFIGLCGLSGIVVILVLRRQLIGLFQQGDLFLHRGRLAILPPAWLPVRRCAPGVPPFPCPPSAARRT